MEVGAPKVNYKEAPTRPAAFNYRHKKQTGGAGQYGHVIGRIEPLPDDSPETFVFENRVVGGRIPTEFIPSCEKGFATARMSGPLAGCEVVRVRVVLEDGTSHVVDSSDIAFQIAGSLAFKKAAEQAGVVLLEPIMNVSVTVPDDLVGDVIGDLNGKRGRIQGMEPNGDGTTTVRAQVPMAEMLRYASDLRSITGGRGFFEMSFSHYEEVPPHIAQKVVEEAARQRQASEAH